MFASVFGGLKGDALEGARKSDYLPLRCVYYSSGLPELLERVFGHILLLMSDGDVVTLIPIRRFDYWRVKMSWPRHPHHTPRYFGKFETEREAQKWIEAHRWMTEQKQEP